MVLLRGFVESATWWSGLGGVMFGAGYVALSLLLILALFPPAVVLVLGLLLYAPFVGGFMGLLTGFAAGPASGLVLAVVTRLWFVPLRDARRYR